MPVAAVIQTPAVLLVLQESDVTFGFCVFEARDDEGKGEEAPVVCLSGDFSGQKMCSLRDI